MARDRFKKYLWILNKLYSTGGISFKELAKAWDYSSLNTEHSELAKRTFDTHRREIEETFDINIYCDASDGYKYRISDPEGLRKDTVKSWLLSSFAVNNIIQESVRLKNRIVFDHVPSGNEFLMAIVTAMEESRRIKLTYQSFHVDTAKSIVIEPLCVKVFKQRWYMVANSTVNKAPFVYALDRILKVEIIDDKFVFPDSFDADIFFNNCFGVIVMPDELDVEEIQIKVTDLNNKRKYFRLLPIHKSQNESDKRKDFSIFTYRLYPTYDFFQEILSHGSEVEVLSPEWVRNECRLLIKEMYKLYE